MDERRLVEVFGRLDGRNWECGSGYLIGRRLVLTCAHAVPAPGHRAENVELRVFAHPSFTRLDGRVLWRRYDGKDSGVDAALVEITTPGFVPAEGFAPTRWGVLEGRQPGVLVQAAGFPKSVEVPGQPRELDRVTGLLDPLSGFRSGRHPIHVASSPDRSADGSSNWGGMSGAPVFGQHAGQDLLLGVVVVAPESFGDRRLLMVPSRAVLGDEEAVAVLQEHDVPLAWSPWSAERTTVPVQPAGPQQLDADVIPRSWDPDEGPAVFRCTDRYRLDALAGATLGAFSLLVASDRPHGAVAATLDGLRHTLASHREIPLRAWFQMRGEDSGELRDPSSVRDRLAVTAGWEAVTRDGAGDRVGVIVPVEVGVRGVDAELPQVVRRTLLRLRAVLPAAALLVEVRAGRLFDATRAASVLASALDVDEMPPASLALRPADRTVRGDQRRSGGGALATLAALIQEELDDRHLHWPVPDVAGAAGRGQPAPDEVVVELNQHELPLKQERRLLRQVRALLPGRWPELLHAHARGRAGAGQYASLVVAAECAEDLAIWLDASGTPVRWPDPAEVPGELMDRNLTEAVLLELLTRRGSRAALDRWFDNGVGQSSRVLRAVLEPADGSFRFDFAELPRVDQDCAGLVAQAAVRCGLSVLDLPKGSANHPLYWAMLVRGGLSSAVLEAVARLPQHLRAVLDGRREPDDVEIADATGRLRQQIPHLTTRSR